MVSVACLWGGPHGLLTGRGAAAGVGSLGVSES